LRKLPVILLLVICGFNGAGYRLMVLWLEDRSNVLLESSLDKDEYNARDEIVIMTPITCLSYYNSSLDYIRQDGDIDIDGESYKFVKMRLHGDSVEVICIPDYPARKSLAIQEDFVKWNTDMQQTGQGRKSGSHHGAYKIIAAEYDAGGHQFVPAIPVGTAPEKIFHFLTNISTQSIQVIENPPEILC
jgi:hypothetical protein